MVHLAPLPGSARFSGTLDEVAARALRDARALVRGGVDGILIENFGDAPFFPDTVPAVTVAAMTRIAARVRDEMPGKVPIGINVLRNDAHAALAIAVATGAAFVRVNVLIGATVTDQGLISGRAHEVLRVRASLAPGVLVLADARVKHGRALAEVPLAREVLDLAERGLADVVLVTGERTGDAPRTDQLGEARAALQGLQVPVWIASGVTGRNARSLAGLADGFIVGSSFKRGGRIDGPVDPARVGAIARLLRG